MILFTGAMVLPDRVLTAGSLLVDGGRIAAIENRIIDAPAGARRIDDPTALILPGFIDVHVHGVEGIDVLDGPGRVAAVAGRLPRYGVTAFCPTTVACTPAALETMLEDIGRAQSAGTATVSAHVLPAHLESNFINPEYKGAQPLQCLRLPAHADPADGFTGADILAVIERRRAQVGIVTIAPELPGGLDLVRRLTAAGHRVSIGHTAATYEQALEAIDAGVCHATHLFNRMTPMTHRAPGVPGAVLTSERVAAELVCDGHHVHPSLLRVAINAKGTDGVMAITDGTAASALPTGTLTRLGSHTIRVGERTAELADGTIAGSILTMDGAFRVLVEKVGLSWLEAVRLCSTTPAEQLELQDQGRLVPGGAADLAILDVQTLRVKMTVIGGRIWQPASP